MNRMPTLLPRPSQPKISRRKLEMQFGIIAAGEGSRLVEEGSALPKPLVSLCGTPMIGRLLKLYADAGASTVSIIIKDSMPEVKDYVESLGPELGLEVRAELRHTPSSMHTFFELMQLMRPEGRFVVSTVDTVFRPEEFMRYVEAFRNVPDSVDGLMGVTDFIDDEKPLYVEADSNLNITAFSDSPAPGSRFVSGGLYGLSPKAIDVLGTCLAEGMARMRNFQRALLDARLRLKAFPMGKIIDVDHLADLRRAQELLIS